MPGSTVPKTRQPKAAIGLPPIDDQPAEDAGGQQNVRAVTRALAILSSFQAKRMQSLAEVTASTGLDKGTTRRLLLTMMKSGFVVQDPATQHYRLGRAVKDLAASVAASGDFRSVAAPFASALAAELHMTAFISTYADGQVVCLDRIHDMKGIEVHWWAVGGSLPFNCGAAPKLLLAYQPAAEIARVLKRDFVALTPKSIMDRKTLSARLDAIREKGWELAVDDVTIGLSALAVPVRHPEGEVVGSLSLAGLTPQMVQRGRPVQLRQLQDAAAQIERSLG